MSGTSAVLPALWNSVALWVGLCISLAIFSLVVRENPLARLAQYILVGCSLGYTAVLVWQNVLQPRLFGPLVQDPAQHWPLLVPLGMGLLLCSAALERLRGPGAAPRALRQRRARGWLSILGGVPLALLLGTSLGNGLVGAWQGTLLPQLLRAAQTGLQGSAPILVALSGTLTLVITVGVLLSWTIQADRFLPRPNLLRALLKLWIWIGDRALWVAAGVIFARLLMARFTLLIARFDQLLFYLEETDLWRWAESIWQTLVR